jgi:serine/threonine-protein kinase
MHKQQSGSSVLGRRGGTRAKSQPQPGADAILQAGQLVDGKYRVERLLGEGGMAAVWVGTNERTGKHVALKVVLRSLATMRVAQGLFHSEVLAASLVNHPNVVTVFDVIEHEGLACIVMELLEGEPLSSTIARKGFLSVNEAVMLLLPAMRGVAAANARGVIHRDLKPQNIFICMEPDGRIVTTKVLDFGISVMVERGLDSSAGLVLPMGTPAYMSPEHILGVPDIDGRADVYGFGVLLYESLTGQMPFPGEPSPTLFDNILHKPAVPVTAVRPDLPAGLVGIIEKAMAKDRDQRYADVTLLAMALEDELTPATPAPRLLTPQAGVPSFAAHDPLSALHEPVVQAVLNKEPSGEHQGTRILYAFPLQSEDRESAAPAGPNGGSGGSESGSQAAAPPLPSEHDTAVVDLGAPLRKGRSRGFAARSAFRGWGGLLGAGVAVVIGFFAVSGAMRGVRRLQTGAPASIADGTPPAREPVVQPAVPASSATVDPAESAPLTISPPPPAPSASATPERGHHVRHEPGVPVLATSSRSRVAVREASNDLPRQQAGRQASGRYEPAQAPPSARRVGASAKSPVPRAGTLSEDDF